MLAFKNPIERIIATSATDLRPALARIEHCRNAGFWLCGYLSYEAGYLLEPALACDLPEHRDTPLLSFAAYRQPLAGDEMPAAFHPARLDPFQPRWRFAEYQSRFDAVQDHLRKGDIFQVNLTFPMDTNWEGDPLGLYEALTARQPVRYAAFLNLGGPVIVSRSPELFFRANAHGVIETCPMKGTMPRGETPEQDLAARKFLQSDDKNCAENRMIVDLLRNDLSRICIAGSVSVPDLFSVETYPTLHQMVSRIRAHLQPGLDFSGILTALFPCGSITGAPKISAMKIIREQEVTPRGIYCGAIGWISPAGDMEFSVAIRTIALFPDGKARLNVGSGIVLDSTARTEYDECLLKARFASVY